MHRPTWRRPRNLNICFHPPSYLNLSHVKARSGNIPKHTPWFSGFWERLIGLTKLTPKKILGRAHATLESALLNDRPLTYVSSDIDDPESITPSQ